MINTLLEETNEKYYWLGFLVADGHFSYSNSTIKLTIHKKDLIHLEKFAKFCNGYVNYKEYNSCFTGYLSSKEVFNNIVTKYGIHQNKTKNPINLDLIPKEFMLPFIVGFIDGDGSIYSAESKSIRDNRTCSRTYLKLQIHLSWLKELGKISKFLLGEDRSKIKLASHRKSNVAELVINNHKFLKELYVKVLELDIPYLQRKWTRCNNIPKNFYDEKQKYYKEIEKFLDSGMKVKELAKKFKVTTASIYLIRKNLNLQSRL